MPVHSALGYRSPITYETEEQAVRRCCQSNRSSPPSDVAVAELDEVQAASDCRSVRATAGRVL